MFLDDLLKLASAQTATVSAASTSTIATYPTSGMSATSNASDVYQGAFLHVRISTAYAAGAGVPHLRFQLQTASRHDFRDGTTLLSSSTLMAASLTAGAVFNLPIPSSGLSRFIRGYVKVNADNSNDGDADFDYWSAGAFDMYIVKDVDSPARLA